MLTSSATCCWVIPFSSTYTGDDLQNQLAKYGFGSSNSNNESNSSDKQDSKHKRQQSQKPNLGLLGNRIRNLAGSEFSKNMFERYWQETEEINGVKVISVDITIPKGDNNTSIHSHAMDILKNTDGQEFGIRASKPGENDASVFSHFRHNVIVGSLELPHYNAEGKLIKSDTGAVFYDRTTIKSIATITKKALQLIIKP